MATQGKKKSFSVPNSHVCEATEVFRRLLGEDVFLSTSERGLKKGVKVILFALSGADIVNVGTAKLGTAGEDSCDLQRTLHLHSLPRTPEQDLVVITSATFNVDKNSLPFPYTFKGGDGVPKTLSDVFKAGFYVWDTRMMMVQEKRISDLDSRSLSNDQAHTKILSNQSAYDVSPFPPNEEAHQTSAEVVDAEDEIEDVSRNASVECGKTVNIRRYSLAKYEKAQVWVLLNQILEPDNTLRDVDIDWVSKLKESFTKFDYEYSSGLMTVTVLRSKNVGLEDLQLSSLLEDSGKHIDSPDEKTSRKIKNGLMVTVVDGLHRHRALNLLSNALRSDAPEWLDQPIRMTLQIRSDLNDMNSTEILHLGAQRNQLSATVRPFSGLEQHISAVRSYLRSFASENNLQISDVRPTNLAEELSASGTIVDFAFETYRRYSRIAKVFAIYPSALTSLIELNQAHEVKLGASHLDNNVFYQVDEPGVVLFMESVAAYVRNPETNGRFQNVRFYQYVKNAYQVLRQEYETHGLPKMSFLAFLNVQIKHSSLRKMSIRELFVSNMRLFLTAKKNQVKNSDRIKRLGSKIENHFSMECSSSKHSGTGNLAAGDVVKIPEGNPENNSLLQGVDGDLDQDKEMSVDPKEGREEDLRGTSRDFQNKQFTNLSKPLESSATMASLRRSAREKRAPDVMRIEFSETRRQKKRLKRNKKFNLTASGPPASIDQQEDEIDQHGYRIPFKDPPDQKFDDLVPPLHPEMIGRNEEYCGSGEPGWSMAVSLPPGEAEAVLENAKSNGEVLHHTPFLTFLHIPLEHRAHAYMTVESILFLHRIAWFIGAKRFCEKKKKSGNSCHEETDDSWDNAMKGFKCGQGKPYFARQGLLLQERGFCILEGFSDCSTIPHDVLEKLQPPSENDSTPVQVLFNHYLSTFPGEELCRDERNRNIWSPIVNLGEKGADKDMQDHGRARYSSTRRLLMEYTEENHNTRWASIRRAMLDVWLCQLAVLLGLDTFSAGRMYTPKTGGRFLITGKNCPRQCPHNDYQVPSRTQRDRCPGYFMIATGDDAAQIWFCEYSHQFVFSPIVQLQNFARALKLRMFVIPKNSVLFGHGFATHAGAGYSRPMKTTLTTRYHLYLTPENVPLPDSVFFAFGSPSPGFQEPSTSKVKLPIPPTLIEEQQEVGKQISANFLSEQRSSEGLEYDTDNYASSSEGTREDN